MNDDKNEGIRQQAVGYLILSKELHTLEQPLRKAVSVFLASPGDVQEEREAIERVVNSINNVFRSMLNVQLDLVRWEQLPPYSGRPQTKINEYISKIDIFIGVLWQHWGQPVAEGQSETGFEQEFRLAKKLYEESRKPEVWLFFKHIEEARLTDPGPSLKKVLEFKRERERTKDFCFYKFEKLRDLEERVRGNLEQYILSQYAEENKLPAHSAAESSKIPDQPLEDKGVGSVSHEKKGETAYAQMSDAIELVGRWVKGELPATGDDSRGERLPCAMRRLFFLANSWLSHQHASLVAGNHEMNLLFESRAGIVLSQVEKLHVTRAILANTYAPGWFFLKDIPDDSWGKRLVHLSITDPLHSVRAGSIELLRHARVDVSTIESDYPDPLRSILQDGAQVVRNSAIEYVETMATMGHLATIEGLLASENITNRKELSQARVIILLNSDVDRAVGVIQDEFAEIPSKILESLRSCSDKISLDRLLKVVDASNEDLRVLAVEELVKRGDVNKDLCLRLLDSDSAQLRAKCLEGLIELGEPVTPGDIRSRFAEGVPFSFFYTEPLFEKVLATYDEDTLRSLVDFFGETGTLAFKQLATKYFDSNAQLVREGLDDGFQRFQDNAIESIRAKVTADAGGNLGDGVAGASTRAGRIIKKMLELKVKETIKTYQKESVNAYTRNEFIYGALEALVVHGQKSDVKYARMYLTHENYKVQSQAIRLLIKCGDETDVETLLGLALQGGSDVSSAAAEAALLLCTDKVRAAKQLRSSERSYIVHIGLEKLSELAGPGHPEMVKPLLQSSNETIRRDAFIYLKSKLSSNELESILSEYVSQDTYYYNVVCWLDRLLYSPEFLSHISDSV